MILGGILSTIFYVFVAWAQDTIERNITPVYGRSKISDLWSQDCSRVPQH